MAQEKEKKIKMGIGKIYYLSFGGTEIVGRYKGENTTEFLFHDCLHNWSGYESFRADTYTVKHGIETFREATDTEKQSLLRHSIANKTI